MKKFLKRVLLWGAIFFIGGYADHRLMTGYVKTACESSPDDADRAVDLIIDGNVYICLTLEQGLRINKQLDARPGRGA